MIDDALAFAALRRLEQGPASNQRVLAQRLGLSLGKANYLIRALLAKGLVKTENVRRSDNRSAYLYVLTPHGMAEKARLTKEFLRRKVAEYERLQQEIETLAHEIRESAGDEEGE